MNDYHSSVLLKETIDALSIRKGAMYIDATLGGGGHTEVIREKGGRVLGIDQDEEAIAHASQKFATDKDVVIARGNFRDIQRIAQEHAWTEVAGILFDVGVSSHQLDTGDRGFSFVHEGPLDMRMDTSLGVKAVDLLHGLSKKELALLFERFGEEPFAHKIAQRIVETRRQAPIATTTALADIIVRTVGWHTEGHPATRVFQALRIAVNDELHSLEEGLQQAYEILEENGRIAVISFHSLEDRIAKEQFRGFEAEGKGAQLTKKPVVPSQEEMEKNPRSRSAKLRVFEKTNI